MHPLVAKALELAAAEIGTMEKPLGSNMGKRVEYYQRRTGYGPGVPWCACLVWTMIDDAAHALKVPNPFLRTGACRFISAWATEEKILVTQPQAGDVFLSYRKGTGGLRARHTGFVSSVADGAFKTIEGNSNLNGSAEGIGIFTLTRRMASTYRFVRWSPVIAAVEVPVYTLLIGGKAVAKMPVQQNKALAPVRAFGEALGLRVDWDQEEQAVTFSSATARNELAVQIALIQGVAHAPVRELAEEVGLQLRVNAAARTVEVFRA